jgi:hypothetical protein
LGTGAEAVHAACSAPALARRSEVRVQPIAQTTAARFRASSSRRSCAGRNDRRRENFRAASSDAGEVLHDPAEDVLGPDQVGGAPDAMYRSSQVSPDILSQRSSPVSTTSAFRSAVARINASGIFNAL